MGGQNKRDTLADMPRFGGRSVQESEVSPVWLNKELFKKVTQEKTKEYQTASSLRNFETCVEHTRHRSIDIARFHLSNRILKNHVSDPNANANARIYTHLNIVHVLSTN